MKTQLIAACLLGAATCPSLAQTTPTAYAAFAPTSMFVIAEHGADTKVKKGVSPIDPPNQVTCASAGGCTLMATSQVVALAYTRFGKDRHAGYAAARVCTQIDGIELGPTCKADDLKGYSFTLQTDASSISQNMQTAINLTPGVHTVETVLHLRAYYVDSPVTGMVQEWTISYTLYGH